MALFSDRLRSLRQAAGLSQLALAEALGVSNSSINMYERGQREPSFALCDRIAQFFDTELDYLMGRSPYKNKEEWLAAQRGGALPLLGEIACGQPIFTNEEQGCFTDGVSGADFCLRARGDSMVGARIWDGDLVFIRRQEMVENGEIAAVVIEDSATLKRVYYYPEDQTLILQAENPRYPPLIYRGAELEQVRILGRAIAFRSEI